MDRNPEATITPSRYELALEAMNTPGICLMRCILALSGLFLFIIHAPKTGAMTWTYTLLFCYGVYSAALYYHATRRGELLNSKVTHWLDVAWYLALTGLSGGTKSLFFLFFFFAILVSSFRFGFAEGIKVTLASALLSSAIGFLVIPETDPWRGLLQPICLVVLGYLIARWGDSEILLKKRLTLLRDLNRLPNPRFGIDQAIGAIIQRLRSFYNADSCLAITCVGETCRMHVADEAVKSGLLSQPIPEEMAKILLGLPAQCAAVYYLPPRWRLRRNAVWRVHCDVGHPEPGARLGEQIANVLDTQSYVSVPMQRSSDQSGRLYVTSRRQRFSDSDMHFVRQLAAQLAPVIENIRLLDRIASEAAGFERQKISRDLHDSTIQPYIGLKIGLEALRRKVSSADPIARDIDDLCEMTHHGIAELRRYVADLKSPAHESHPGFLLREVWKAAERFSTFHGIKVEVNGGNDDAVNDRLAAEIIQIVSEGLSNIKRHTHSQRATVNLRREEDRYVAQIINHGPQTAHSFVPRSISERAGHLGGKVNVQQWDEGTAVTIEIPL